MLARGRDRASRRRRASRECDRPRARGRVDRLGR
jgi:hypothetical protein